jgi:tRNA threonylcarbamoyladenosine biosynthesis protein TsaE
MKKTLLHPDQTEAFAAEVVLALMPKETHATVIGLRGDLGAGKTAFVKGAGKALGITEHMTSPTFVIEKRYALEGKAFSTLVHIDAYRLKDGAELVALRFAETLKDPKTLILIEWPDHVASAMPSYATYFALEYVDEQTRTVVY